MKFTATITESSHQDPGPCYLHLPIFSYKCAPLLQENTVVVIAVFLSKLDTYHCSMTHIILRDYST